MSPLARYALPALAAAGSAYAACSTSGTATIQNQGDVAAMTTCSQFSGSIAIQTGVSDIQINGIKVLNGNLVVQKSQQLSSLSADQLTNITGTFRLESVEQLNVLNFPKLAKVNTIEWNALPALDTISFNAEVTEADVVRIVDTGLSTLKGINLQTVREMFLASNRKIEDFSMEKLARVTEKLELSNNNVDVNVSLPNLAQASNMTFRNCSSVDLPSLERVNGSLGLYSNPFTSFTAPNLTYVGGALVFVSNTELANLSLPLLTEVKENLEIANNTKLSKVNSIPKLKTVRGALDFNGNMTDVDLPELKNVYGAFNIQSTGDIQKKCDDFFKPLKNKKAIEGKYECKGKVVNPGGEGTKPSVSGGGGSGTNAASPLNVDANALWAGFALAFLL